MVYDAIVVGGGLAGAALAGKGYFHACFPSPFRVTCKVERGNNCQPAHDAVPGRAP
jgi:hypothetical protein